MYWKTLPFFKIESVIDSFWFGLNLIAIIALAIIMERATIKEDSEAIYEMASRQTDEKSIDYSGDNQGAS